MVAQHQCQTDECDETLAKIANMGEYEVHNITPAVAGNPAIRK